MAMKEYKPFDSADMEIRKVPWVADTGLNKTPCPVCGERMMADDWQIEVGYRLVKGEPPDGEGVVGGVRGFPNLAFLMCMTCAVTALRRVFEYREVYQGRPGGAAANFDAAKLCGPHPTRR